MVTIKHRAARSATGVASSHPRARRSLSAVAMSVLFLGVTACNGLLDVTNPGRVAESDLDNPALIETLVNSALGQFECAYTQYVATAGIMANEYVNSSSWLDINGWGWRGIELKTITGSCPGNRNATGLGAYTPLQQARYQAEDAARRIDAFPAEEVADREEKLAYLSAYAGYAYILLGEGYCEMAIDQGPLMTPPEVLAIAETKFTEAIGHAEAAGLEDLRLLAVAGRARTRLDLGNLEGAASDAEEIPEGYVWNAEYSTTDARRENRIYNLNRRNYYLSVEVTKNTNLMAGGAPDPRISFTDAHAKGNDGVTDQMLQNKYPTADSPIPMASWNEAQLIIAEARPAETIDAINRLRASQGIPDVTAEESADPMALVIEERRRQLFSEGHRLNDMLRHHIPFPTGVNHKGQPWGTMTCMPLPDQEKLNNPNIGG
jgi:hypothetical protein